MKQKKNKFLELLQLLSQSFMIPIAIMPLAGLMLGIGAAMQTGLLVERLPWLTTGAGSLIASLLRQTGNIVFSNLGLIFAIGVAMGMCENDGVAALSGTIGYLVLNKTIEVVGNIDAEMMALAENRGKYTTVLGMSTLQTGVFSGILVGILTAYIFKRFHKTKLPAALEFFQGKRLVAIVNSLAQIVLALVLLCIWPYIQAGLTWASANIVEGNQAIAAFIHGAVTRALIPLGLHHVWNVPFYYLFGAYTNLAGEVINGDYNIYFAQLADGVRITAGSFCGGGAYVLKMFALPGAALAMYKCSKPENRKKTGGLLLSVTATAFLTGVTEPLEFTILFAAFPLYGFYVITSGLAFMLCNILNIKVGLTFAGGLIDFILLGVLQNSPNWYLTIPLGVAFFFLFFFVFKWAILKFDFITPGREEKSDERMENPAVFDRQSQNDTVLEEGIIKAFGGAENILALGSCATRLRVTVKDENKVDEKKFKSSLGAAGVVKLSNNYQIVYGPKAQMLCDSVKAVIARGGTGSEGGSLSSKKDKLALLSPCKGNLIRLEAVSDPVFSQKMAGDGFAIEPEEGIVCAPVDGIVSMICPTGHAIGLTTENGRQILLHVGLDTVNLKGEGFDVLVKEDQEVKAGETLLRFSPGIIKSKGYAATVIIVFPEFSDAEITVKAQEKLNLKDKIEVVF